MNEAEHDVIVSIIVPVYNAELYLKECIESLLSQTIQAIEIILVNDGSTDKSEIICKEYVEKDSRIKLYTIPNGGVSNARNTGLQYAKGEWVTFVDSDDWVDEKYCEHLLKCSDHMTDFVIAGKYTYLNKEIIEDEYNGKDFEMFDDAKKMLLYQSILSDNPFVRYYPNIATCCSKLYKRSLLVERNIKYNPELKYYEDALFNMQTIAEAEKICYSKKAIYYYRLNDESSTHVFQSNTIDYYEKAFYELEKFETTNDLDFSKYKYYFNVKNLNTILNNYSKTKCSFVKSLAFVIGVCNRDVFRFSVKKLSTSDFVDRRRKLLILFSKCRMFFLIVYMYNRKRL